MTNRVVLRALVGAASAVLLLSGCGGGGSDNAGVAPLETSFEKLEAPQAVTGAPGTALDAGGGISVTVSEPRSVTLSEEATGVEDAAGLSTVNAVDVTVVNGSDAPFAPFAMTVQILSSDGVTPCVDVFDDANNLIGTPFDDIAPGDEVTFAWGYSCTGPVGDSVTVRVLLDIEGTPLDVTTSLVG